MPSGALTVLGRIACLLLAAFLALNAPAQDFVAGEVVVGFKPLANAEQVAAMEAQLRLLLRADFPHIRARHYRLPPQLTVEDALPLIQQYDFVAYAEPNYLHKRQVLPTDPRFGEQWYLRNTGQIVNGLQGAAGEDINWQAAGDLFTGTREVIVAVVDTGIALEHPELSGRLWVHPVEYPAGVNGLDDDGNGLVDDRIGWDFYDNDMVPRDENGHGTLVASLIAAAAGNGQGGVGVSPTARIMALRAGNDFGSLPLATTISAFTYAARRGARIINYSAGGGAFSNAELATIQWLASKGVLLVAAAGNGGSDGRGDNNDVLPTYPAAYPVANIIAVAAIEQDGDLARFSNYGASTVHIAAPGTNILGATIKTSTHYYENFETGAPGWTPVQLAGSASTLNWGIHVDPQGNRWYTDSPGASGSDIPYQANTDSALVSPPISLVGVTGAQLSARVWHQLERNYDYGLVELSDNDGATWAYLGSVTGYSYGACPGCGGAAGTVLRYDLSRYEGKTIRVRFRLISDSVVNYSGWFVDDVRITRVEPFQYDGTQYQFSSGTSFAAPLVAGAAALIGSQRPDLTSAQVRQIILGSARQDARLAGKVSSGGKLDVHAALQAAIATPAGLVLSADFVDFGKQTVGGTGSPQMITLRNDGASTVSGFSFNVSYSSGSNAFPLVNDCGVLVPGASCTVSLQFAPPQFGEIEGSIRIETTASGSPHVLNVLGVGAAASGSATYAAAGYSPLIDNASKTWLSDGASYTSTVLPGTALFGGVAAKQILDSDDGVINYYTNDANGILYHGYFLPPLPGDTIAETLQLSPPLKMTNAQFSLGETFSSNGSATITYSGIGSFVLSYTATSTPAAFETVTVPAGTFRALRVDQSLHIFGAVGMDYLDITLQGSDWTVEGIGSVKSLGTTSDGAETTNFSEVVTAASLLDASPDPFALPPLTGVAPGTQVTSASITVQGINAGVSISVSSGQYSVDGGAWTGAPGMVFQGQTVAVRLTASTSYDATTSATLTIGGATATFVVTTAPLAFYPVTVLVAGGGTVTSNPAGINCGSICAASYAQGTSVTLTATASSGFVFAGWTGACTGTVSCTLTVDAARNVSASFTALAPGQYAYAPELQSSWNLLGNALDITLDVATVFGGNSNITSVWKWDASTQTWAYYSPALTAEQLLAFTTSRAYQVLASIGPGEGYWVNATAPLTLSPQIGTAHYYNSANFAALAPSWNLLATADGYSPHAFSNAVSGSPPPTGGVNDSFFSLWAWDAVRQNWYYYSPALENTGSPKCGLPCVKSYTDARGLLHFEDYGKTLGLGVGFWVNRP